MADRSDRDDPPTASSVGDPVAVPGARPVPSVGCWVGPPDEPARYERLELVGGGAEGTIHRARFVGRAGAPRPVALKQYRRPRRAAPDWPADGTWHQIRDQALMLAGLPATGRLVRVLEVFLGAVRGTGVEPGEPVTPFVVMEWVDGVRPDVLLDGDRGAVSLAVRLAWVVDLAAAVDLLHSTSRTDDTPLVHGDIKPGNCLVDAGRGLVLVDTGAVHPVDGIGDHRGLHSPPYAAPEVVSAPGRRRAPAADLYSLGAVAVHLVTREPPPDPACGDVAGAVGAALRRCADLPARRRDAVAAHLLQLLDPDPGRRATIGASAWARELTRTATPPRRDRRRTAGLVAGVAVVALVGAVGLPPLLDGTTTASGWPTVGWTDLDPFEAGVGAVLYAHDFTAPEAPTWTDWPDADTVESVTRRTATGYALHVTGRGTTAPVPAPPAASVSDEVVSATATVTSGQGIWGVWCRGVDAAGTRRYGFQISHTGAVRIVTPDNEVPDWVAVTGLDLSRPVTLAARCADVPGAPVELTLAVNGRVVLGHRPTVVLGPGYAGIEGATFADVEGPTITAEFNRFAVHRSV